MRIPIMKLQIYVHLPQYAKTPEVKLLVSGLLILNNADLISFKSRKRYNKNGINAERILQALAITLLKAASKLTIAHPLGADRQMRLAWGGKEYSELEAP